MTSNPELTVEEYRTLVETAVTVSPKTALTVYLVGHTGMVTGEAANFTPDWFNEENRLISIPKEQDGWSPKSPIRVRNIPLSEKAADQLVTLMEEAPDEAFDVSNSTIYRRIKSICEACNIENVSPHSLRILYITRLNQLGVPIEAVSLVAGMTVKTLLPISEAELTADVQQKIDEHAPLYGEFAFNHD